MDISIITHSAKETEQAGKNLAHSLPEKALLCFFGELGAGKTTFIKGIISELTALNIEEINSPTFTYLNPYQGKRTLYHFDLYRIKDHRDFLARGFNEYIEKDAICCIEWAEKITSILPSTLCQVTLRYHSQNSRMIVIKGSP